MNMKSELVAAMVAMLLVVSFIQALQINSIKGGVSGNVIKAAGSGGGETYDEMMARMHPDQVKKVSTAQSAPKAPTMVGGC